MTRFDRLHMLAGQIANAIVIDDVVALLIEEHHQHLAEKSVSAALAIEKEILNVCREDE